MKHHDIIVAGGGISGATAAIAAARAGADVLLIEQNGYLGGMLTAGGVGPMMTFHAGEKQVIQGITSEIIDRLVEKGKSPGHIKDSIGLTDSVTPFDAEALKHELEIMLLESGGKVLYHTMLAGVYTDSGRIESIAVCNKAGLSNLSAKVYIDATGDADLSAWAGVDYVKGREKDGLCQPMTMNIKMYNVDIEAVRRYFKDNVEEFPYNIGQEDALDGIPRVSVCGFETILKKSQETGEISFKREFVLFFETNNPGEVIINTSRVLRHDSTDPVSYSDAEIEGRKQVRELEEFLKKRVPGFEKALIAYSGPCIGVRSSRQIKGLYTLTEEDILKSRKFYDTIAHSGYQIDIHNPEGQSSVVVEDTGFRKGMIHSIPYRCLINEKIDNLITVGRCISATFTAQGAIRTAPTVGAIGHAGGIAAFIAAYENTSVREIDINKLRSMLKGQKAYLEDC